MAEISTQFFKCISKQNAMCQSKVTKQEKLEHVNEIDLEELRASCNTKGRKGLPVLWSAQSETVMVGTVSTEKYNEEQAI
jgi:hypothetical protein